MTITFNCLSNNAPSYLCELISLYQPNRSGLRSSSDQKMLSKPRTHLCSANKGFFSSAPNLWNNLPSDIRHTSELQMFKSKLKTHLF